jgi:dolichyl-phosphate mannosyltransferase polypeptide 3
MTRARRVALLSAVFSIAYILVFFAFIPVPLVAKERTEQILPVVRRLVLQLVFYSTVVQLPWWLLVSFGSYALWSLGHGVFTFRECTDAYTELLTVRVKHLFRSPHASLCHQEISQAKSELRLKGVSVD